MKHVAIIMDGNRTWAKAKGLAVFEGHKKGAEIIDLIVDRAIEQKISYLTFWAFSTENWRRKYREVNFLMNLLREKLAKQADIFNRKNIKINILGDLSKFPKDIQAEFKRWVTITENNKRIVLNMALSYGGRDEILRAISKLSSNSKITEEKFSQYLDTVGQPDPDLIIRTGGQQRLSGFLTWQSIYSELYFTNILWPDFTAEELDKAIEWYKQQKRNFGR